MAESKQNSFLSLLIFGSIFIFVGAFIFLMAIDVIHIPEEDINVPRWVLAAVGLAFALAGVMVMVNGIKSSFGDHIIFKWVYNSLVLLFMIIFASPFHWIAFGGGERSFSSSMGVGGVSITQSGGGDFSGRLAFGCGAVFMDLFIVLIIHRIVKGKNLLDES